jgi:hypothetical protein
MEKIKLELYTDYLICNNGFATATGLSAMMEGDISHDQMTRFLASKAFTSKDLSDSTPDRTGRWLLDI